MQATTCVRRFAVYCFLASVPCAIASVAMAQLASGVSPWMAAFNVVLTVAGFLVAAVAAWWLFRVSSMAVAGMEEADAVSQAAQTPPPKRLFGEPRPARGMFD